MRTLMHRAGRGLRQSWLPRECPGEQREHEACAAADHEKMRRAMSSLSIIAVAFASVHRSSSSAIAWSPQRGLCTRNPQWARRATHKATWSLLHSGALLECERSKEGGRIAMALDALVLALSLTVVSLFLSLVL
jgi:hypothetical protein